MHKKQRGRGAPLLFIYQNAIPIIKISGVKLRISFGKMQVRRYYLVHF